MVSAWQHQRRTIDPDIDMPDRSNAIQAVMSPVLTNRESPLWYRRGAFRRPAGNDGHMYAVSKRRGQESSNAH